MGDLENLLMLEFLSWISARCRTYSETMEAWQSHCPRQTIWEDALIDELIELNRSNGNPDPEVVLTARGRAMLDANLARN
jgi:hypothetical protein